MNPGGYGGDYGHDFIVTRQKFKTGRSAFSRRHEIVLGDLTRNADIWTSQYELHTPAQHGTAMTSEPTQEAAFTIPLSNGLTFSGTDLAQQVSAKFLWKEIFKKEFYDRPAFRGKEGDNVLDIGANMGLFALWMSPQIGSGKMCCVEPSSAFDTLEQNIQTNGLTNIRLIRCAVGAANSTLDLLEYPEFNGVNHNAQFTAAPWGSFLFGCSTAASRFRQSGQLIRAAIWHRSWTRPSSKPSAC